MNKKNNGTQRLILAAMFAALCTVATMVIQIPAPTGYVNLGDAVSLLAGLTLGPVYGFAAAGLGGAMADLLLGYFCELDGSDEITLDRNELSEAGWYHRNDLPAKDDGISLTREMVRIFGEGREPR